MKIKGNKAQVQITLPPELVEKARRNGLNISKIAENALNEVIRRLESPGPTSMTSGGPEDARNKDRWAGPDSNRRPSARQADVLPS